jgi:group I intron endonuclease
MNSVSGIYKIYCEGNNKVYIGSSVNVRKRRNEHLHHLRGNKHPNRHLQHSYNKYGEASFGFSVVLECEKEILLIEEEKCIRKYNSYNEGFNLIELPTTNLLGYKHTEKSIKKMSESAKKRGRVSGSLTTEQVKQMRQQFFDGARVSDLSNLYGVHRKTIRECIYLKTYQDVPCEISGYTEILEELKEARENGKRPRSKGWKHSKEFIAKFTEAVSKPRAAHKRALTPEQVRIIRLRAEQGETCRVLASEFGVNQNSISRVVRRLTYKDVD